MKFTPAPLAGAFLVDLEKRGDDRGFFARGFCEQEFAARGQAARSDPAVFTAPRLYRAGRKTRYKRERHDDVVRMMKSEK